jgi:hypothetical protein
MGWSPLILIEIGLVFGAVLAWGFWELRTLRKANAQAAEREREQARKEAATPERLSD